jgi:hypothetical protein
VAAALLVAGAARELVGTVHHSHRIAKDRTVVARWLGPSAASRGFVLPGRVSTSKRVDIACVRRTRGGRTRYRQCALIVPPGSSHGMVRGGYRLPAAGRDARSNRYACFGLARSLHRCPSG